MEMGIRLKLGNGREWQCKNPFLVSAYRVRAFKTSTYRADYLRSGDAEKEETPSNSQPPLSRR